MRKLYKNVFSVLALSSTFLLSQSAVAQFGCGSAVVISDGYTATGITTPGTGGAEDWNTNPTGTSITGSYWDDDVYLFEYTATAPTEMISMTINSYNSWNGIGIFDDCTGTTFSNELDAVGMSGTGTRTVTATISAGNTVYIAVGQWGTPNDLNFDVTDFTVTAITCPDPSALTATNITGSSADLGWTENGSATMWNVEYGATGFVQGTGTMVTGTTSNPLNVSTLSPSSTYDFYVQADCGGGDVSAWIGPFSFTTPCATVVAPWTESFDATTIPNCWSMAGPEPWLFTTTWMAYGASGVSDHTGNGGSAAGVDGSSGTNAGVELYSPMIDASGLTQPTLEFYYFSNNTNFPTQFNSLIVDAWDGAAWVRLDSIANHDANWQYNVYYLNGYMTITGDIQIRFTVDQTSNTGSAFYNDQIIDDVSVYDGPTCPDPSNLMSTWTDNDSIAFSWNVGASETMWNVEVVPTGMTPGMGNEVYANATTVTTDTASGLTQLTDYDVYVQADCGGGDASNWVGPLVVTTLPNCPDVSGITVDAQSADSLFISWTSNGSESSWDVEYGPAGYTAGSGTMMTSSATNDTITGLMSGMVYDIYVRSDCGGTDQGQWIGPITYSMPCIDLMPVTLPFVEDFESWTLTQVGDSLIYCGTDKAWNFTTSLQGFGRVRTGSDAVTALAGSGSMTLDVTTDNNDAISYAELTIDLSGYASSNILHFSCKYMEHGDETDTDDKVWVRGSDQDPWLQVLDWNGGASGNLQQLIEFDISTILSTNGQTPSSTFGVRFGWSDNYQATSTTGTDGVTFDDIRIEEITCYTPANLVSTYSNADTVVIDWTANGPETEWAFEYGPTGFTPGSGTVVNTMNHPDTVTGLTPGMLYDFYVAAVCGAGDTSNWFGPVLVVPNVLNDSACNAIMVPVDGSTTDYANHGSTSAGEPGDASNNTVWFEFVAPASGHVAISTCGTPFDTELSVFDTISDCLDYPSYVEIGYADWNPWNCSGSHPAGIEMCGLIPGETYKFRVGAFGAYAYSTFPLTLWDLDYEAGTGSTVDACAGIDTLDLTSLVTGSNSLMPGYYDYPSNPSAIVDDTMAVAGNFTLGNDEVYYIVGNDCMMDTAFITVNVATESFSGDAVDPFMSCNTDVYLPNGLTGVIDNGGTWSDDSGTGLLAGPNGNVFVAADAPAGTYPFTYTADNGVCPPSSTTVTVTISDCSGVDENGAMITMYPNPNNGSFFIMSNASGENNIVITDISGKVIYNNVVGLSAGNPFEITLDNVESGMYMVNISNASGSKVMNVVIK